MFAQPLNLLRPAFWSMLYGILRFNRICKRLAHGDASAPEMQQTLKQFLQKHAFGAAFKNWLVWSSRTTGLMLPSAKMLAAAPLHSC